MKQFIVLCAAFFCSFQTFAYQLIVSCQLSKTVTKEEFRATLKKGICQRQWFLRITRLIFTILLTTLNGTMEALLKHRVYTLCRETPKSQCLSLFTTMAPVLIKVAMLN